LSPAVCRFKAPLPFPFFLATNEVSCHWWHRLPTGVGCHWWPQLPRYVLLCWATSINKFYEVTAPRTLNATYILSSSSILFLKTTHFGSDTGRRHDVGYLGSFRCEAPEYLRPDIQFSKSRTVVEIRTGFALVRKPHS
jgi:hypothetical protein